LPVAMRRKHHTGEGGLTVSANKYLAKKINPISFFLI